GSPTARGRQRRIIASHLRRRGRQRLVASAQCLILAYSTPIGRVEQLEPRPAFELALRVLAGRRIDLALAGLAQEARLDHQVALGGHFLATLLEENAADRRFARRRRKIGAGPARRIVAVDDG